jgi:hypothetical protein
MRQYLAALRDDGESRRLGSLLGRIVVHPGLHARMLNTLARLEYVGVRKMLKSRRAEHLDLDGLQHMLDEAAHALRLKRAAVAAAADAVRVDTFADADTLAGDQAEGYFQAVDRAAQGALAHLPEPARGEANYLLTSAVIEIRAQAFYPLYEAALRTAGAALSVAAILRDEDRHLAEMAAALARVLPDWRAPLEQALAYERQHFARFVDALEAASDEEAAAPAAAAS